MGYCFLRGGFWVSGRTFYTPFLSEKGKNLGDIKHWDMFSFLLLVIHTQALAQLHSTHVRSTPTLCFSSIRFIRPPVLVFHHRQNILVRRPPKIISIRSSDVNNSLPWIFFRFFGAGLKWINCGVFEKNFRRVWFFYGFRSLNSLCGFFFQLVISFPCFLAIFLKYQDRQLTRDILQ